MSKRVQRVWNGKVIEGLKAVVMGRKKSAEIIACLNALLSWEVKSGQKTCGEIQISDTKTTLLLPKGSGGGTNSGGGEVFQCQITQLYNNDYFWCRKYDGSEQSGAHFYVAKAFLARKQAPPSGFTYTSSRENARMSIDGASNTEAQVMNESYAVGNIVLVKAADHTGVTVDGDELKYIEDNPERFWVHPVGTAVISGTTVLTP